MSDLIDQAVTFVRSPLYIELTVRQFAIIGVAMGEAEPVRVKDMARTLNVAKPVVTRALDALERHGFVERRRGEDKRDRFIHVTDAGIAFRSAIGASKTEDLEPIDTSTGGDRAMTHQKESEALDAFVTAEPVQSVDDTDEDGNPVWSCEIQTVGGWSVAAQVWGASADEACRRADAARIALAVTQARVDAGAQGSFASVLSHHRLGGPWAQYRQEMPFAADCGCGETFFAKSGKEAREAWQNHVAHYLALSAQPALDAIGRSATAKAISETVIAPGTTPEQLRDFLAAAVRDYRATPAVAQPDMDAGALREAVERFLADYDDGDRAEAGNSALMEAHIADLRAALIAPEGRKA